MTKGHGSGGVHGRSCIRWRLHEISCLQPEAQSVWIARRACYFCRLGRVVAANHLANAGRVRNEQSVVSRPVGEPIMAIISLRDQQITVYDDKG